MAKQMFESSFTLDWHGDKITKRMTEAARLGIDDVLERAVDTALARTPVRSGKLAKSMKRVPAKTVGNGASGSFGSYGVPYAHDVERKRRMIGMAAEEHFKELPGAIRKRFMSRRMSLG